MESSKANFGFKEVVGDFDVSITNVEDTDAVIASKSNIDSTVSVEANADDAIHDFPEPGSFPKFWPTRSRTRKSVQKIFVLLLFKK